MDLMRIHGNKLWHGSNMHAFMYSHICAPKFTNFHPTPSVVPTWPKHMAHLGVIIRAAFICLLPTISHLHAAPAPPSEQSAAGKQPS